jgi:alpha-N-acetylglucosaminidase
MMRLVVLTVWICLIGSVCRAEETQAVASAKGLVQRLLPDKAERFTFERTEADAGRDVFEIETADGRVSIRGNSGVSMAVGLNWYLKHYCHCDVSWYGSQLNLPDPLPSVQPKFRAVGWARYRYFLNYCCFGYSLPWWDWAQWEKLIDWMALNGVNAPLAVTGQEAVWQDVCRRMGLDDKQTREFLAGPPFLPFGWMGCLDGWGGPLPQSWIDRHDELGRKILARERALGMTPILQGFTGHIPPGILAKFPEAKSQRIRWSEWETQLLDPMDPLFAKIAAAYMEEQTRRFGSDHYYAADTFIEMLPPSGDPEYLGRLGRSIYDGMAKTDPQAVWVLQGWAFSFNHKFWTQPRIRAVLGGVPDDRMLLLDLYCESTPMWNQTEAFCGKPWAWCFIQNFGRKVHLGGALDKIVTDLPAARRDPGAGRIAGLGFVNEGLCYNPVAYDLMFEMAWRQEPPKLDDWLAGYAHRRYGRANADAQAAWSILHSVVYSAPCGSRSIIDSVPTLRLAGHPPYSNFQLSEAWRRLLQASGELGKTDTYRFDLVNVARQVLSNHAATLQRAAADAHREKDHGRFVAAGGSYLELIRDLDDLLATRGEFLLGSWLEDAKRWGDTDADRARFEWNARRVLTLWGAGTSLRDYARKEWAGMLRGFYAERWERYLTAQDLALKNGETVDEKALDHSLWEWERDWSDSRDAYPAQPKGDSVAVAQRLWDKYASAFEPTHRSLTTGKPVSCSHSLPPYPPGLANDGRLDTDSYWATDVREHPDAWWRVDLLEPTTVSRVVVVAYYGDRRSYGFLVEASPDGKTWETVADRRDKPEESTANGYICRFEPRKVRYLRVTETSNTANTGRHLVEVMAFEK